MASKSLTVRGAVLREMGRPAPYAESRPLEILDLDLAGPGPGELLVRIRAAGLCHSDLSVINGSRPRVMPMVLGHEASGDVVEIGADTGFAFVRDAAAHRAAMGGGAAYLPPAPAATRDPWDYVPELSRRARGFATYAAIRQLGATGIAALVERDHDLARRMAARLANHPGLQVLNEVVLNQVLVAFDGDADLVKDVVARVQRDGTTWMGASAFHGRPGIRISVSGWTTTEEDIDRSADAILRSLDAARAARPPA
jgi:threonine dehydrogenase-like Zn-dependent dehydrogenase